MRKRRSWKDEEGVWVEGRGEGGRRWKDEEEETRLNDEIGQELEGR